MAKIEIDDVAKTTITSVINGVIDEFQATALQQLIATGETQVNSLVEAEVKAYCDSLTAYAEKTNSWWVKIRNKFLVSIIMNSTDAIVEAVVESVKKIATEGIDDLQKDGVSAITEAIEKSKKK